MPVETWQNQTNFPFILSGSVVNIDDAVLLQDAGRTTPLATGTLMAQIAATQKWVPLTDIAATDGSARARGIFISDDRLPAAYSESQNFSNNGCRISGHSNCPDTG